MGKSLVTMLMKAKAKPEATLLTNGPLAVGDSVEVKESGVVHECKVVQVAEDLVQVHGQGWNARYDTWVRYPGSSRQALRDRTNKVLEEIVPNLALKSKTKLIEASPKTIEMKDGEVKPEIKVKEEKYVKTNPGLSEYELIRLENIRQREALFAELNLDAAKVEASPRIERTVSAPSRRGLQSEKKEKEVLPRRASTRLAGGSVKEIERYNPAPEPEARNDPEIAAKTLGLEEITDSDASSLLSSLITSKKSAQESQIEFSNLSINPERVAKVVPERIFSVAFHPGDKLVAAAGDKWGKVGLWDCEAQQSNRQMAHTLQGNLASNQGEHPLDWFNGATSENGGLEHRWQSHHLGRDLDGRGVRQRGQSCRCSLQWCCCWGQLLGKTPSVCIVFICEYVEVSISMTQLALSIILLPLK